MLKGWLLCCSDADTEDRYRLFFFFCAEIETCNDFTTAAYGYGGILRGRAACHEAVKQAEKDVIRS